MPNTHTTLASLFSDIADAIRAKTGGTDDIVADDFPSEISNIPSGGGDITVEPLSVTVNGTYTAPTGKAYSPVTVNVSASSLPTGFSMLTPDPLPDNTRKITIEFDDINHVLAVAVMCGRDYVDASGNTILCVAARASTSKSWYGYTIYASSNGTSTTGTTSGSTVAGNSITLGNTTYGNFIGGAQYYIFVYKEAAT